MANLLGVVATIRLLLARQDLATTHSCAEMALPQRDPGAARAFQARHGQACHGHSVPVRHCALVNVRHDLVAPVVRAAQVGQVAPAVHAGQVAHQVVVHTLAIAAEVAHVVADQVQVVDQLGAVLVVHLAGPVNNLVARANRNVQGAKSSTIWRLQAWAVWCCHEAMVELCA